MAIIKRNIIGTVQGGLADVIFRVRNGKLVAYSKPARQKVSRSKSAIQARNKFALTVSFAKEINSDQMLSKIWKQSDVKASSGYQKIIKLNSVLADNNSLTLKNLIVPDGIKLSNIPVTYANHKVEITLNCSELNKQLLKSNRLYALIHLWRRGTEYSKPLKQSDYLFRLFGFDLTELDKQSQLTFIIDIEKLNKPPFPSGIVYIALAGQSENKLFWSSNLAAHII